MNCLILITNMNNASNAKGTSIDIALPIVYINESRHDFSFLIIAPNRKPCIANNSLMNPALK